MEQKDTAGRSTAPDTSEVLRLLSELAPETAEGVTVQEMMLATGRSRGWCREQLVKLIAKGQIRYAGTTVRPRVDGQNAHIPVYRLVQ